METVVKTLALLSPSILPSSKINGSTADYSMSGGQATAAAAAPTAAVPTYSAATAPQGSRAVPGIKYRHVGKSGLVVSNLALGKVTTFFKMLFIMHEVYVQRYSSSLSHDIKMRIQEISPLVGRYCSFLLHRQDLATFSNYHYKTLRQT